jgi:hypothetical protein
MLKLLGALALAVGAARAFNGRATFVRQPACVAIARLKQPDSTMRDWVPAADGTRRRTTSVRVF